MKELPTGLVPKRLAWMPLTKNKLKDTMFVSFDLSKDDDGKTDVDYELLSEMFCRKEEEVKAEKERLDALKKKQLANASMCRAVLETKFLNDTAMALASLRIPAQDVVDALLAVDDFALNAEQASKLALIIPSPEQEKLLEANRPKALELTKEEQYLLELLRVPGI